MSTSVHEYTLGYHEYIKGCSARWKDVISTSGDIMIILEDIQYFWGYHDLFGGAN